MKKRINKSILAATSLTAAASYHHQTEANPLILTPEQLSTLSLSNAIQADGATTLDFKNLTPEIVASLGNISIDLSSFQTVREIILPWFAAKLNIKLPSNFGTSQDHTYGKLEIINGDTPPSTDDDLNLDLTQITNGTGNVIVNVSEVPIKGIQTGPAVSKLIKGTTTTNLTVSDTIDDIKTIKNSETITDDVKTSITLTPSAQNSGKASFTGFPTAILALNPDSVDISLYRIDGQDVTVSGMPNLEQLITGLDDTIGTLKVTGDKNVALNVSVTKVEITSAAPDQAVVAALTAIATTVAPSGKDAHIASFAGKTDLDFSKLDLGSVDSTATRIKEIFEANNNDLVSKAVSIKIGASVLAAVMSQMKITNLSSFTALKRLDIISATGAYQASSLSSADLPTGLEEYYSSSLVVRKGTLSENLLIDSKFAASTIDFSGLDRNGKTISINPDYNNNVASTVKLDAGLLSVATLKNLMSAGANKSVIVSGAAGGALTTANLQNVGTIDTRLVTGATSFSAPINVDGNNGHLSKLYLPGAFDVEASADILSGVDNGEVTVYLSGAYSGQKTIDASYDNTILNFSAITGTGRFQLPSGIRGLVLSDAVTGLNVGVGATVNEFDLSGLAHLRQLTNLSTSATVLKLNNSFASTPLSLNLFTATNLTTLQLNSSKVSSLTLPASQTLTDGGEPNHLDLSLVTQMAEINQLNELLSQGQITQVTFPNIPASSLKVNLVDTIEGIDFNNLDKISQVTLDNSYLPNENMWPTVKNKAISVDWTKFFNYITASEANGGINSPSIFDLSGQLITNQQEATALVNAFNSLSSPNKNLIQKIIIRLSDSATGTIDFSAITPTQFNHGSLSIIIDKSTGSTASVTVHADWNSKTKIYESLSSVTKSNALSWGSYLNYHFASLNDKGEAKTSLDLSEISLTAGEWLALRTALNSFSNTAAIQTVKLKLAAADNYTSAPAFTTATLSNATSIIIDVTGVKNAGSQVSVTGLPSATVNLQVEQRVTSAPSVDRSSVASWKGYFEHLLANISGSSYTLDLTASDVQIETTAQLTALSTALSGLSSANKLKIQNIKLKIATGNRSTDFVLSTDLDGFTNLGSVIVDATGALNGAAQSLTSFAFTNEPGSLVTKEVRVTALASVDTDAIASWNYYLAYHKAQNTNLQTLDFSSITLAAQADVAAVLTALQSRSAGDKSTLESLKLKLASNFATNVDLTEGSVSGLDHASFAAEIDRNGANSTAPVGFIFGSGTGITAAKTTIKDSAFTSLGSFDGTNAHHWLGYVRTLLGTLSTGTMTLDLTTHNALELSSEKLAKFITAMNALPASDKAKVATLKVKLASGDFGPVPADLSTITGFSGLTNVIIDRNGARASATFYDKAIGGSAPASATLTINDPESRTVTNQNRTNEWLSYFTYLLNGMTGTTNTLDLSAISITGDANVATAFNNALESLPSGQKQKVQTLKLAASGDGEVGTGVSGFTNLTKVIVDQTAAPTAAISFAGSFGSTQKAYVTSATAARDNAAWAKYISYVTSTVAEGGLNQPAFNLFSLTLNTAEAAAFLSALDGHASAGSISNITLKLNPTFGSSSLDLSSYSGLTSLADDGVVIFRNGASDSGTLATITYGGSFTDAKVRIVDLTASTITDTAEPGQWLGYMTGILNDAATGVTLDLSGFAINNANAVTAINSALAALDSALADKIDVLKLNVTHTDTDITLGTGTTGLSPLSRIEYSKPVGNTVAFVGALSSKRVYLTDLSKVKMDSPDDWTHYLNYMLSTDNGGQSATALNLNTRTFADQAAVDTFFAGLNALSGTGVYGSKNVLTTLRMTLADSLSNISIGGTATGLNANLRIVVNPGNSTGTTNAGSGAGQVDAANLIVLSSTPAFSKQYIAYAAEQPGFNGTLNLTGLNYTNATDIAAELNLLPSDIKSSIKTINLKLQSGNFGSANLTLGALSGFAPNSVTVNIDRNGAIDGANAFGPLVTVDNQTGHTVNLTDAEFHDMSAFNNASSAHWIGYLTHELDSAPSGYTLDLTTHAALTLTSANAVSALNHALAALPAGAKAKVATLKVNTSVGGALGTDVTELGTLATVIVAYSAANVTAMTSVFNETTQTPHHYVASVSADMPNTDWARFFDYQLNAANIGGRAQTSIAIDKRLSSDELTALLSGLGAATAKASLQSLTLNLKSDVAGNINVGASDLHNSLSVVINTNGSAAKLTPANSFVGYTAFSSINNVNPAEATSWAAYLAGQISLVNIDIREVELAAQANLTAFLTALDADSRKGSVATLKLKLASTYSDSVDFSGHAVTILTALTANNSVEVHRNGSTATVVQGGEITDAKIKVVDLTASSLTDRANAVSWLAYLTARIEDAGFTGPLDLSADSDTYVRTNDQLTAFMTGLNNLSPANKALLTGLTIKLAPGASWTSNITNLGEGLTGFTAPDGQLASFIVDATGAYTSGGDQVTVAFHNTITGVTIVTALASVDKDNADAWEFYLNNLTKDGAAALDLSSITLSYVQLNAFDNGLGTFSAATGNGDLLQSIHIKVSGAASAANYAITADLGPQTLIDSPEKFIVDVSGFTHGGTQATVSHTGGTPKPIELRVSSSSSLYRDSAESWNAYLNAGYPSGIQTPTTVDLAASSDTYLRNQTDVNALMSAIQSRSDKANIDTLNVRLAAGNVGSDITFGTGVTGLNPTMNITVSGATNNGTLLRSSDIHYAGSFTSTGKTVTQTFATSVADKTVQGDWTQYLTYLLSARSDGGLGQNSIVAPALIASTQLTALMDALNGLSNTLKNAIQHIHLDISADNSLSTLGTGVSGLSNLQEVTYIRSTGVGAAADAGSFVGKLRRLRTAWNPDTIASAPNIEAFLRYQLMDPEMGGLGQTIIDLTGQTLDATQAGYVNTALGALPDDLSFRITELRLSLNAATDVTFDAAGLRNLSAVKYFQTGAGALTWTDESGVGFESATKTRFRADFDDVTDKKDGAQWAEYLLHKLAPVSQGGLGATTIDVSAADLGNDQVTWFWGGLLDARLDTYRPLITSIKFAVDNTGGDRTLDGGGKTYNDNLKIIVIMNNKPNNTFALGTAGAGFKNSSLGNDLGSEIVIHRITSAPTVTASATEWERWLNHKLSSTFGGDGVTTLDLSGHEFTSQAQLNNFFAGLDALSGSNGTADKAVLTSLTLKLASGNFGSASARIGYTGSGAVTALNPAIAITVQRNGAQSSIIPYDQLVTINHSDIDAISSVDGVTVDNTNTVVDNLSSAPAWLAYLNSTLTAVTPQQVLDGYTLDLTGAGLQLAVGASAFQSACLFSALQALHPDLKAKIATLKIKLAAGNHGPDALLLGGTLNNTTGFTALSRIIVDVTGAETDVGGTQKMIDFGFLTLNAGAITQSHVTSLDSVDLDSIYSWSYYLKYLKATNGNIESIDLSARDLYLTDQSTTQANVTKFFDALTLLSNPTSVKDIFFDISGANNLNINVGVGSNDLNNLTYVGIKRHAGAGSSFTAAEDVGASDLAVINSSTGTLGTNGTVAQWKGYFGYLLEDAAHGGVYSGSNPIALNLTSSALEVNTLAVLQAIESAIAQLPARLKARISTLLIKTTDANVDYQSGGYLFGELWTSGILDDLSQLKAVIINSCTNGGTDPTFDGSGDFYNRSSISKIMYHTAVLSA